jgi:hydroxymethylglutaryl-CoA synthase
VPGILEASVYVPRYRLPARLVGESWRRPAKDGTRAVANHDEDSFTMAATAAERCLRVAEREASAVFFASTSSPYREKMIAPMIAAVADQPDSAATSDFSGSLRSGLAAVAAATDAVGVGRFDTVLVAAADQRLAAPGAELDHMLGDGAAAVLVGPDEDAVATIDVHATKSDDLLHLWRRDTDRFIAAADARFARQEGYLKNLVPVVREALERAGLEAGDLRHVVIDGPDAASIRAAAKQLGMVPEQAIEPQLESIGHTGAAHSLLLLAHALDRANPGDRILLTAYGDGADAVVLTATDRVATRPASAGFDDALELDSYQRYLVFRGLVVGQEENELPFSSISLLRRTAKQDVRFYGARCLECGRVQYPIPRICQGCRAEGKLEEVKLSRRGTVFTLTEEHYFPTADPPLVVAVVDLEGGGRIVLQGTDGAGGDVEIGSPVELVYRRHHEGQGFHNYYWKCRPAREGSA